MNVLGIKCGMDLWHILWWFICAGRVYVLWHIGLKSQLHVEGDPGAKSSFFILCGWRVALLIGMSRGALIDRLIACSPGLGAKWWEGSNECGARALLRSVSGHGPDLV